MTADPEFADAYDVMRRVQIERGDFEQALQTYRRAVEITPASIARLQKQGTLAVYLGRYKEAEQLLHRATPLSITSRMHDAQPLVLLAFARFRLKDRKRLKRRSKKPRTPGHAAWCRTTPRALCAHRRRAGRTEGQAPSLIPRRNLCIDC